MNGIGNNLKRIRLLKDLSLKEAGILLNMSATAVSKYEKGEILPDSQKIIEFADAYNVNCIDILKVYDMPKMKFTSFRKNKKLTGQNLDLLEECIQKEVTKNLEVIQLNKINTTNIKLNKYTCNSLEDAELAAIKFRNYIGISNKQPISDLVNILENLGITIIQIANVNNKFNGFDGLSEVVDNIPIIVLLDEIKDGARQRFTIAHELGHLLLSTKVDTEKLCNRFASALLMPKDAIINEFGSSRKNISFFELKAFKKEYKVSYTAIIYRLRELNVISQYLYKKLSSTVSDYVKENENNVIEPEVSYQFKKIVHKLQINEIISLNKACELLGVSIDEYNQEDNNY